ncbi:lrr receptor-like serine threonine-protein kinase [Hordeum vulgare]|nr:lrr receptor-like serine threonine-protein kinase [Hordeum vulgare]
MPETSNRIKRGNHLPAHRPIISPQIPSPPHRLPLPHRHRLALLHCLHRIVSLSPTASSSSPSSPPSARGDASAAAGDVVELQGAVTIDEVKQVGGVNGGVGKLATAADVEKEVAASASALSKQKVTTSSGALHPDTPDAQPSEEQEDDAWGEKRKLTLTGFDPYDPEYSDDEEYEGNFASFTTKEVEKIKAKGVSSFYNFKIKKWRCPYYTTKVKPNDGRFDHLVSHAEDVAIHREDYMIRGNMLPSRRPLLRCDVMM